MAQWVAVAVAYVVAAEVGRLFSWVDGYVSPVWPPIGVSLAAVILAGRRVLPGVALGSIFMGLVRGASPLLNLVLAAANVAEPLVASWLLEQARFRLDFGRLRNVITFVAATATSATVGATIGVTGISLVIGSTNRFGPMWFTWWSGSAIGAVVLGIAILAWWKSLSTRWTAARLLEGVALLGALFCVGRLAYTEIGSTGVMPVAALLLFPLQGWAAVRFGPRGSATTSILAGAQAIWDMSRAVSGYPDAVAGERLLLLQSFIAAFALTGQMLAAAFEERHRAEERMRLLVTAIGASSDGVLLGETPLVSSRSPRILFANEASARLLGMPHPELAEAGTAEILGRMASAVDSDTAFARGEPISGEAKLGPQGAERHVEWQVSPVRDAAGVTTHFVAVQRDLTSRRASEQALRWNEALLRAITRAAPFALSVFEEHTGRVLYYNDHFVEVWGLFDLEPSLLAGAVLADDLVARIRPLLRRADEYDLEAARLRQDGNELGPSLSEFELRDGRVLRQFSSPIFDSSRRAMGRLVSVEDVTRKKRSQDDLARSHERYRALVSGLPDTLVRFSAAGKVLDASEPEGGTLLGCPAAALVARPLASALPDIGPSLLKAAQAALGGAGMQLVEAHVRTQAGERDVEARVVKSGPDEALATLHDVTDHRQIQTKLLLADRMASVGTLAAGVAHEINNPLAFVIANQALCLDQVEALRTEQPSPRLDDCRELLRESAEGTERVRRIVRDLKVFSRGRDEEGSSPVDLRAAIDRSVSLAWNEIRHKAQLVKLYGDVPRLQANEARLGQVFLNLIVNAAQAIAEGDVGHNQIRIVTRTEAAHAVVEISDTGSGIAPEHLPRIFDPFFTTKPVGVGTGLGLAICHQIVTAQHGEITVESVKGKGTTFRVRLPLHQELPAPGAAVAQQPAAPPAKRHQVLVVDDEVLLGRSLTRLLANEHDVQTAASGREALALLDGRRFDVILCDLMMPELSGMDVHAELLRRSPDLAARMVFLTGGAFTPLAREFLERVPNPRVEKPFNLENLKKVVRDAASSQGAVT